MTAETTDPSERAREFMCRVSDAVSQSHAALMRMVETIGQAAVAAAQWQATMQAQWPMPHRCTYKRRARNGRRRRRDDALLT